MRRFILLVLALVLMAAASETRADGDIRDAWLAAYPDVCQTLRTAAMNCSLCHSSVPARNPYGADLEGQSNPTAIENSDSDGDSVINGTEILVDCTLPGDPNSVPVDEEIWSTIKKLYR